MPPPHARKQKVSLEKYLQSRHEDSSKFEARLKQIKPNDTDASQLRIKVCELLTDLILTDPSFACGHGLVDRLWRLCFYDRIRMLRASRDKLKRKNEDFGKYQDALMKHVSEAISLYNYLTETLEDKLMKAFPVVTGTQMSEIDESDDDEEDTSRPRASKSPEGVMKCLVPMIVQLGDLHRYGDSTSQAQVAYKRAIQLGPGIGHAMNQLAVILSQTDPAGQRLVTLYWYARSVSVTAEPFTTSTKNLVRLFESNQEWLAEQELQQQSNSTSVKSAQSKLFAAKFCQLHSIFFHGFMQSEMADIGVYQEMKECREMLSNLLQNSALGDSLLCKLVTIHAFSETVAERVRSATASNSEALTQATAWASRVSTLWLGTALAERVLSFPCNKGQQQKKTPVSYRCLVPMMLVAEYVSTRPIPEWTRFDDDYGEPDLVTLHATAETEFWKSIVKVLNHIQSQSPYSGKESITETALLLKEYLELRGFLPFATFVPGISSCGRLSDEDAAKDLSMRRKSKSRTQESGSTLTSGASLQSIADNADQNRIKVLRLLALGKKWEIDQSGFAKFIQFDEEDGLYVFEYSDDMDHEDDDHMVLSNGDELDHPTNDVNQVTSPSLMEAAPVVYHKSSEGGPELLLPSYLLEPKQQVAEESASRTPMDTSDNNLVVEKQVPRLPLRQLEHVDPLASSKVRAAAVNPPPGFGGPSTHQNGPTSNQNEYGLSHNQHVPMPAIGLQSPLYRLFGDDNVKTSNPFADMQYQSAFHPNRTAPAHPIQDDDLFGHHDDFGTHGASLLDSGLWSSIFNEPPPPTKNPFAT